MVVRIIDALRKEPLPGSMVMYQCLSWPTTQTVWDLFGPIQKPERSGPKAWALWGIDVKIWSAELETEAIYSIMILGPPGYWGHPEDSAPKPDQEVFDDSSSHLFQKKCQVLRIGRNPMTILHRKATCLVEPISTRLRVNLDTFMAARAHSRLSFRPKISSTLCL